MTLMQCYSKIIREVLWRSIYVGAPFSQVWPLPIILCAAITIYHFITLER